MYIIEWGKAFGFLKFSNKKILKFSNMIDFIATKLLNYFEVLLLLENFRKPKALLK